MAYNVSSCDVLGGSQRFVLLLQDCVHSAEDVTGHSPATAGKTKSAQVKRFDKSINDAGEGLGVHQLVERGHHHLVPVKAGNMIHYVGN